MSVIGIIFFTEQLHLRLVKAGVLSIILGLAMTHDSDLAFWAAALLLNLAMTSGMSTLYQMQKYLCSIPVFVLICQCNVKIPNSVLNV